MRLAPVLRGLAILEDGYDQTTEIAGLPVDRIEAEEAKLLERVKRFMARLPFEEMGLIRDALHLD
ncbi:MAG: hypothetical protein HY320_13490 [Armatimonadetes bacterium]|nr:hypothetical protein [Armatimonadota bacterium]